MNVNISKEKTKVKTLTIEERLKNFNEIVKGYDESEAINEAKRCLNCKDPRCVLGCPAHNNIPMFIKQFIEGDIEGSYNTIQLTSNLSSICSRVCDQSRQCEGACIRNKTGEPVAIGLIERYISDYNMAKISKNAAETQYFDKKVAIVGSGPAGISCALKLSEYGYNVTIFEANDKIGGLLYNGIPRFRLPNDVLNLKLDELKKENIEIKTNSIFGFDFDVRSLKKAGYSAIFIGVGAQASKYMGIPGEDCDNLITSSDFLNAVSYGYDVNIGKKVIVVGGGNAAIDAARTAIRLNGVENVKIVYRRTKEDMPASISEIEDAINEGIELYVLTNPKEIVSKNGEINIICTKMEQTEVGSDGRRKVKAIENSDFSLNANTLIYAIGNSNDEYIQYVKEIEVDKYNKIKVDSQYQQCKDPMIFAGGDVVTGPATVVEAMVSGIKAANSIHKFLNKE